MKQKRLPVRKRLCRFIAVLQLIRAHKDRGNERYEEYFRNLLPHLGSQLNPKDLSDIRRYTHEVSKEAEQAIAEGYPDKYYTGV